jgi:hypothetical protein
VPELLSQRALNRATLARQLLLERSPLGVVAAVEQLVSLQAQFAKPVHAGLWTRLAAVDPAAVTALVAEGALVRATMMRHTLHVVSAADYLAFRHVIQPGVARSFEAMAGKRIDGLDREALLAAVAARYAEGPATMKQIRDLLEALVPEGDVAAMGYLARSFTEIVQSPSGTGWGWAATPQYVPPSALLGAEPQRDPDPAPLLRRYLAAFGPASVRDMQVWSGLSGLKATVEGMRGSLMTFVAEDGRELFDLPDAPRPPTDTPAPPRLLPEFDNLIVGHQDRTRLMRDEHRRRVSLPGARVLATFLVDGLLAGSWRLDVKAKVATVTLTPFVKLTRTDRTALTAEAEGMARFLEPGARDVAVLFAETR